MLNVIITTSSYGRMLSLYTFRMVGEVVDQMILFQMYHHQVPPSSVLLMIHVKEYHLMMVGTDVVECLHEVQAC